MHSKDKGSLGEAIVTAQILEHNCSAFLDFGDNSKIDVIIEDGHKRLHRVQIKTCARTGKNREITILYLYKKGPNYSFSYDATMIDWFAVVDIDTKKIAWVNAQQVLSTNTSAFQLRHCDPVINTKAKMNWFNDYITFPFLGKLQLDDD